jgi:stage II sporulation protein D
MPSGAQSELPVPQVRVALSRLTDQQSGTLKFDKPYKLQLEEARYVLDNHTGVFTISVNDESIVLKSENRYFNLSMPVTLVFTPTEDALSFQWNKIDYPQKLIIEAHDGQLWVINQVDVETYLTGVLPHEIPSYQREYQSAVLAQAIAARSYVLNRMINPVSNDFHLWADERDQVYKGFAKPAPFATEAVEKTRGLALADSAGKPAKAYYHASSGGVLERDVPAGSLLVPDYLLDVYNGEENDKVSPYYRWVERRSAADILGNLKRLGAIDDSLSVKLTDEGYRLSLDVTGRTISGRVSGLDVSIDKRQYSFMGLQVRQVLADTSGKPLPSNLFFMKSSPSNPDKFFIIGAGAGHGRGMSQWGAIGMALRGVMLEEILKFYYPGYTVKKFY